jgi:superfamily II DNA or RNA helicase
MKYNILPSWVKYSRKAQKHKILCQILQQLPPQPKNLALYDHQAEAVRFLSESFPNTAIVQLAMGTGKTLVALYFALIVLKKKVVFITPYSAVQQLASDCAFFPNRTISKLVYNQDSDINIMHHKQGAVVKLKSLEGSVVVMDECHLIKRSSQLGRWATSIVSDMIIGLTGTPSNDTRRIWTSCQYVHRRNLEDIKDLPFSRAVILQENVALSTEERLLYDTTVSTAKTIIAHTQGLIHNHRFDGIRRQLSGTDSKIIALIKLLKSIGTEKVVVFSSYKETLVKISTAAKIEGLRTLSLPGKRNVLAMFAASGGVLLCNVSCGHGLNLAMANVLVLVEPAYTVQLQQQIEARIQRIGQGKACRIYEMVTKGTLEEKMQEKAIENEIGTLLLRPPVRKVIPKVIPKITKRRPKPKRKVEAIVGGAFYTIPD